MPWRNLILRVTMKDFENNVLAIIKDPNVDPTDTQLTQALSNAIDDKLDLPSEPEPYAIKMEDPPEHGEIRDSIMLTIFAKVYEPPSESL